MLRGADGIGHHGESILLDGGEGTVGDGFGTVVMLDERAEGRVIAVFGTHQTIVEGQIGEVDGADVGGGKEPEACFVSGTIADLEQRDEGDTQQPEACQPCAAPPEHQPA